MALTPPNRTAQHEVVADVTDLRILGAILTLIASKVQLAHGAAFERSSWTIRSPAA